MLVSGIAISASPRGGNVRKVDVKSLTIAEDVIIMMTVCHVLDENGERINNLETRSFEKPLYARNSRKVTLTNQAVFQHVIPSEVEGEPDTFVWKTKGGVVVPDEEVIGQYDFFKALLSQNVSILILMTQVVQNEDLEENGYNK